MWSNMESLEMAEQGLLSTSASTSPLQSSVLPSDDDSSLNDNLLLEQNDILLTNPDYAHKILKSSQRFHPVPTVLQRPTNPANYTRIACISDTHGKHRQVSIPQCDILLHGGDFTQTGEHRLVEDVGDYFGQLLRGEDTQIRSSSSSATTTTMAAVATTAMQNTEREIGTVVASSPPPPISRNGTVGEIICIAGNHDITFQPETYATNYKTFHPRDGPLDTNATKRLLTHCTYLQDESYVSNGITFYGSPWSPEFGTHWAFNRSRLEIHQQWDLIPPDTDVLLTHGPPIGRGDLVHSGVRAGCVNLLQQVQTRIHPRIHLFGHIHESYGVTSDGTTLFVNASSCTLTYNTDNPCIVIDLPHDKRLPAVVVKPQCTLSGEEVVAVLKSMGKHQVAYCDLIPLFEEATPLVEGMDLVRDDLEIDDIMRLRLEMHRQKNWFKIKRALRGFIMDLRVRSY